MGCKGPNICTAAGTWAQLQLQSRDVILGVETIEILQQEKTLNGASSLIICSVPRSAISMSWCVQ